MNCPACKDVALLMTERQGIEIDYCPQCRGVWLDRGELDRLIDRASEPMPRGAGGKREEWRERPYDRQQEDYDREYGRKRRRSFLGDLFDFD
ncbi:MAG: zf-TFIIB domain-containing protein [Bacillota bacterium]